MKKPIRWPIGKRVAFGLGPTYKIIQAGPLEFKAAHQSAFGKRNDPAQTDAFFDTHTDTIFIKKHMRYADKVRCLTHEVVHAALDWLEHSRHEAGVK